MAEKFGKECMVHVHVVVMTIILLTAKFKIRKIIDTPLVRGSLTAPDPETKVSGVFVHYTRRHRNASGTNQITAIMQS